MAIVVQPKAPSAPVAPPSVDPAATESPVANDKNGDGIPDEILQIPAMQAVLAGSPAAVSAPLTTFEKRPEALAIIKNKDALLRAGFGLYKSLAGDTGVIFNTFHMHEQELQAADKAGKLLQIAPSFDQVNQSVATAGPDTHPLLQAGEAPQGPKGPPMAAPPQMNAAPAPSPASVQNKLSTARTKNLAMGSPTSGSQPGAGRLLNNILKPVI